MQSNSEHQLVYKRSGQKVFAGIRLMLDFWLSRWKSGQTGWHEADGNTALQKFWPPMPRGSRVLVPLCGKSPDLHWLAGQGCDVTGVELSEIAARDFFDEAGLLFEVETSEGFSLFRCPEANITIVCGNYFEFSDLPFDALYDRASLVALPPKLRPVYIEHTKSLLKPDAQQLLVTLEYDQSKAEGPPFSVMPDEVKAYWPGLRCVDAHEDISNSPPKFRDAGITTLIEAVWVTSK